MADVFLIAGEDQITNVLLEGISIEQVLTSVVDTCSFSIKNVQPSEGDEIIVELSGVRMFAGIIDSVNLARTVGGLHIWDVTAQDYTFQLNRRLVVETYEGQTADWIAKDIILKYGQGLFTTDHVRPGAPTVSIILFDYMAPSDCFKKLAEYCGWEWFVDYSRDVWFFDPAEEPAYLTATLNDSAPFRNLKHSVDTAGLRNRVYVRGGTMLSAPFVYEIKADGAARTWPLPHKPHNLTMQISGAGVIVGTEGVDKEEAVAFLVNVNEKYVKASKQTVTPTNGATLTFSYRYDLDVITTVDDLQSQAALAGVQGGDGVYEHVIVDKALSTIEAAEAAGMADLRQNSNPKVRGSFETEMPGWMPGQYVSIDLPDRGIQNTFMIQKVTLTPLTPDLWTYQVSYGGRLVGIPDVLQSLVSAQKAGINVTTLLNKLVYGTEGLSFGDQLVTQAGQLPFYIESSREELLDQTPYTVTRIEDVQADFQSGTLTNVQANTDGSLSITTGNSGNRVQQLSLSGLGSVDQTRIGWEAMAGTLAEDQFLTLNDAWDDVGGSGTVTKFIYYDGTATDGVCLRCAGGMVWNCMKTLIPFDATKVYVIKARIRQSVDPTAGGAACFVGVEGLAADGLTLINAAGADAHTGQYFYASNGTPLTVAGGWQTFTGYVKGYSDSPTVTTYPNPASPGPVKTGVAFIRPVVVVNHDGGNGTADIDFTVLEFPGDVVIETNLSTDGGGTWQGWQAATNGAKCRA
ncbi:hypothetical protein [Heliophilum fasciatum]|uniref:Phage minor structural protein n=1 Tax=Heliophilum fasciatum TaxID=35700 RepID=A0A4R2RJ38_9FIRM|nr:hypothetical protein [Heliophilum fasciatum]MCW2278742.1 hypothetical protein [Heliophilum fasciatum]TCP62519.1 hypothetical protein EDD73_12117 [Heliophilum fasciatum]